MPSNKVYLTVQPVKAKHQNDHPNSEPITVTKSEAHAAHPRPGGYLKSTESIRLQQTASYHSTFSNADSESSSRHGLEPFLFSTESTSREQRIRSILEKSEWKKSNTESEHETSSDSNALADNMLAVTISCVMLMASNVPKISDEHLNWTENYLSCIRDDFGNYPPNIQGILDHIKSVRYKMKPPNLSPSSNKKEVCTCGAYCPSLLSKGVASSSDKRPKSGDSNKKNPKGKVSVNRMS